MNELKIKYRQALEKYLIKDFNLKDYDDKIINSGLRFTEKTNKNEYQNVSALKFIYIRNDIHLERLNDEEIEVLKKFDIESNELFNLIENTFRNVIAYKADGNKTLINYFDDIDTKEAFVDANALFIVIEEEFIKYGLPIKEVIKIIDEKKKFIEQLKQEIIMNMSASLMIPVQIYPIIK